jgi:hypothetical protein
MERDTELQGLGNPLRPVDEEVGRRPRADFLGRGLEHRQPPLEVLRRDTLKRRVGLHGVPLPL